MARPEKHVLVCSHSRPPDDPKGSCLARGAKDISSAFAEEFEARSLWGKFKLTSTSCLGVCEHGPAALVYPDGVMYGALKAEDVPRIIDEHLIGNEVVQELKVPADVWE